MNLREATIRVIDFETTGTDPQNDKVCEVGWCDVVYEGEWKPQPESRDQILDPGIPIPSIAKAVHHIHDDEVAGKPKWEDFVGEVESPQVKLFAAHNADFDKSFAGPLAERYPWLCTYRLALHRLPDMPSYKNQVIRYELGFEKIEGDAHRAGHDATVTAHILAHMLNGATTELTVEGLIEYSEHPVFLNGAINFGKHKGTEWRDLPVSYLNWMRNQGAQSETNPDGWDRDQWYTINKILGR